EYVETTISEHIHNQGMAKGKIEGKAEGVIEGQLATYEQLYKQGLLSETMYTSMTAPLRQQLEQLQNKS
ncbi:MAG: hypothetical protein VSS52_005230, partial [Thiotrichaceae bacterium]|nr:hypothetical protein [Thiotrichaceae bacterium]